MDHTRRAILRGAALLAGATALGISSPWHRRLWAAGSTQLHGPDTDIVIRSCAGMKSLVEQDAPIGDIITSLGLSFLGTPYKAHTLEVPGPERLVVNLRFFDCLTFVESTVALARATSLHRGTYEEFSAQLRFIRYRGGVIDGYPSRLHYFTDWVMDNETKGVVRDMTRSLGGIPPTGRLDFMSTHATSYRQLAVKENLEKVKQAEARLNAAERFFLPKDMIADRLPDLRTGDVIATTTTIKGIDVSHSGLAVMHDGIIKFLHAPLSGGSVQLSHGSLAAYMNAQAQATGILVARPLAPVSTRQ
jgi:cell wall-associated NlpC family hydrolase